MRLPTAPARGSGEPRDPSRSRALHGVPLVLVVILAFVGTLVAYALAVGSAHQLNSSHTRLGIYSIDDRHVGFRYYVCSGEIVDYVELTLADNGSAKRVWRMNTPNPAALGSGMAVPVVLELGRDYEVVIQVGRRQAG
jgi:hypothetical protein